MERNFKCRRFTKQFLIILELFALVLVLSNIFLSSYCCNLLFYFCTFELSCLLFKKKIFIENVYKVCLVSLNSWVFFVFFNLVCFDLFYPSGLLLLLLCTVIRGGHIKIFLLKTIDALVFLWPN